MQPDPVPQMKTKTTVIATETLETLSVRLKVRTQTHVAGILCEECAAGAPLLPPEDAAPRIGLSVRALYRLVEDGLVHFKETPDGLLLVCISNLNRCGPNL